MPVFECVRCNDMTYSASAAATDACPRCGSGSIRVLDGAFAEARAATRDLAAGDHATLLYDDPNAVAPFCARYLTEGIDAGERVAAALPEDVATAVRSLLAADVAVAIDWSDAADLYGDFDPDRVAAMYDAMIGEEPRTTRILAGLDGESAKSVDPVDFDRYERLAHAIVTNRGANVVCLSDTRTLSPQLVEVALRRHGLAVDDGAVRRNDLFEYEPA